MILNRIINLYKNKMKTIRNADNKIQKLEYALLAIKYQEHALEYMLRV
jgi:hypothetical protein